MEETVARRPVDLGVNLLGQAFVGFQHRHRSGQSNRLIQSRLQSVALHHHTRVLAPLINAGFDQRGEGILEILRLNVIGSSQSPKC